MNYLCISFNKDNIKTNSAPGPNGIPRKFIKMAKLILVLVFTKFYNKCVKKECFPDECLPNFPVKPCYSNF